MGWDEIYVYENNLGMGIMEVPLTGTRKNQGSSMRLGQGGTKARRGLYREMGGMLKLGLEEARHPRVLSEEA